MNSNHPDFEYEQQHLSKTIEEMEQIIKALEQNIDERVDRISNSLSMKDEVSAYVHSLMKSDNAAKIYDIERALGTPYFGRVDFRDDEAEDFESFYIGRTKVARLDIQSAADILVFDWRDPVSTIFYECQDGRASYEVLGRYTYNGDVRLKRQYKIEDGKLLAMSEDNVLNKIMARQQQALIADPFLQERLLAGATDKLKDIVTSIRSEQNQIIREAFNQVTVIQGVAGSGKSTIGLHRLSYLLYNEKLNPARLVVVAPNRIFLDYISDLLPDIDASDVKQLTFEDLAVAIMQMTPTIKDHDTSWLWLDKSKSTKAKREQLSAVIRWKGSPEFVSVMQSFLEKKLEKFCLKLQDISLFDGKLVITREQQLEKVVDGANVPYNERLRSLMKYIRFRVRNYLEVLSAKHKRGHKNVDDDVVAQAEQEGDKFQERHFAKWPILELITGYGEVFKDKQAWKTAKKRGVEVEALAAHSLGVLGEGQIEREDLAPLCYLKYLLDGIDHIERFDHIVVDEGQDLNLMEYTVLARLSRNTSFTVMGDMSQGIYAERGLDSWQALMKEVFGEAKWRYHEVNYSYRSAKEIVDLFNYVLPEGRSKAIPVYEIGRQPVIERVADDLDGMHRATRIIEEFLELGARSVGVLARRSEDSQKIYDGLKSVAPHLANVHLITGDVTRYQGGITVAPIMLAKGLEFDAVLVWNAAAGEFADDYYDAKLLYVALSRAMYYLHVLYQGKVTPLLHAANGQK